MGLCHFGPVAGLGYELLLGKQVVGEDAVQLPDFVEFLQLCGGVLPQVAGQFPHPGPVLLLHVGAVVLVAGVICRAWQWASRCSLMNSEPLSELCRCRHNSDYADLRVMPTFLHRCWSAG